MNPTPPTTRHFLNVLKYLGNELKIPLVGVGTGEWRRATDEVAKPVAVDLELMIGD